MWGGVVYSVYTYMFLEKLSAFVGLYGGFIWFNPNMQNVINSCHAEPGCWQHLSLICLVAPLRAVSRGHNNI